MPVLTFSQFVGAAAAAAEAAAAASIVAIFGRKLGDLKIHILDR